MTEKSYPLAVITSILGVRSSTFIHRHMAELLPGKTLVIARHKEPYLHEHNISFPYFILEQPKRNLRWLFDKLHYLGFSNVSMGQAKVAKYLKEYRVKIILSEYLNRSLEFQELAQKMGIRFYTHAHGYDVSYTLNDPVMRYRYLQLEKAAGIITMSEYSRKKLIGIGLSGNNIHVIPYGVDVPDAPTIRQTDDIIRCLAVGRMVAKKAPLFTLEAFKIALDHNPKLRLDYIGDGELFDEAGQFIRDNSLENCVTLHGGQPNSTVHEFMKKANIFLQHSRTDPLTGDEEGLPVAILEAMAKGLPVVSTRHAGIPEEIIEEVTGYLVNEGDIRGMAAHIVQLAEDFELRERIGKAAWARAKQHFSWEKEKSALLKLLGL